MAWFPLLVLLISSVYSSDTTNNNASKNTNYIREKIEKNKIQLKKAVKEMTAEETKGKATLMVLKDPFQYFKFGIMVYAQAEEDMHWIPDLLSLVCLSTITTKGGNWIHGIRLFMILNVVLEEIMSRQDMRTLFNQIAAVRKAMLLAWQADDKMSKAFEFAQFGMLGKRFRTLAPDAIFKKMEGLSDEVVD